MYQQLFLFILSAPSIQGHLTGDKAYLSQIKLLCEHAYDCFHDMVLVCGKSVHEARTFLDLCDLYEYSCETDIVYKHTTDEDGCPDERFMKMG
ncbi:hypothetical protein NE865_03208 [Phthorimaea operculella]|nr:hypothetical protein NE865_03208 [Phthorimaea operculella]